jgi:hypothetical protein
MAFPAQVDSPNRPGAVSTVRKCATRRDYGPRSSALSAYPELLRASLAVAACRSDGAATDSGCAHGGQVLGHGERNVEDQDVSVVVSGACLGVAGVDADEVLAQREDLVQHGAELPYQRTRAIGLS